MDNEKVQPEVVKPAEVPAPAKPAALPIKRKVNLEEFLNQSQELKAGKVEILGAFGHHMENVKKIVKATEDEFRAELEKFKKLPV